MHMIQDGIALTWKDFVENISAAACRWHILHIATASGFLTSAPILVSGGHQLSPANNIPPLVDRLLGGVLRLLGAGE